MVEAMLYNGAKAQKLGKAFKSSVFCEGIYNLKYKGPKTPEELWEDENFRNVTGVKVNGGSRIMRTRPQFKAWELTVEVYYIPENVDKQNVVDALTYAGNCVGLGDWRPKFGRFEVKVVK